MTRLHGPDDPIRCEQPIRTTLREGPTVGGMPRADTVTASMESAVRPDAARTGERQLEGRRKGTSRGAGAPAPSSRTGRRHHYRNRVEQSIEHSCPLARKHRKVRTSHEVRLTTPALPRAPCSTPRRPHGHSTREPSAPTKCQYRAGLSGLAHTLHGREVGGRVIPFVIGAAAVDGARKLDSSGVRRVDGLVSLGTAVRP